jgi:PAS domain S-box-containing protein
MIAFLDAITCLASAAALLFFFIGFKRLPLTKDSRYLLAGFLILLTAYHFSLFMEWRHAGTGNRFDRIENFIGTLTPIAWFLMIYCLVKEVTTRELHESEQKLRAFLDHHFEFSGIVDPEGRLVLANKTALDFIEARLEEVVGTLLWETPWAQGNEAFQAELKSCFQKAAQGQFARFAAQIRNYRKKQSHIDVSINPFLDTSGKLQWLVVEARDITRLRKAQALAEETLHLSKTILFKVDLASRRFEYVSPYIETVTGFPADRFIEGGPAWVAERIHPDDLEKFNRISRDIFRHKPGDTSDRNYQLRFMGRNGSYDWYRARMTIRFNEQGRPAAVVGSIESITEQKHAEKILRHYEQIVSHTGDLLALVDADCVYQAVSNSYSSFFGKSSDQLIGRTIAAAVGEDHFARVTRPMAERCLGGEEVHYQTWITLQGGEQRCLDVNYFPYIDPEKQAIAGFVISARDVTVNQRLEEQLRQAHKMEAIGTLAGGIAHDFNNILSAIMGYSELGLSPHETVDALRAYMGKIQQAGRRAGDLVRQILTFSRQSKQKIDVLHLKPLIKEALKFIRASLPATIAIRQELLSDGRVLADPTQIHQIVMNLAANAGYAMKERGGTLTVRVEDCQVDEVFAAHHVDLSAGAYVRLRISDTGTGMPSHVIDRIFDPFYTTKPKDEGTGLGLSVVHGIVKNAKGAIAVQSAPGKGTTFDIYWPRMSGESQTRRDARFEELPGGSERVLFVDDEAPLVEIGKRTLEKLGYRVTGHSSSIQALTCFERRKEDFDLVITDLTMPDLTGDKLAAAILTIRPDMPIIVATGFSKGMSAEELTALGIRKVIFKPIVRNEIAEAIREVLGGSGSGIDQPAYPIGEKKGRKQTAAPQDREPEPLPASISSGCHGSSCP